MSPDYPSDAYNKDFLYFTVDAVLCAVDRASTVKSQLVYELITSASPTASAQCISLLASVGNISKTVCLLNLQYP